MDLLGSRDQDGLSVTYWGKFREMYKGRSRRRRKPAHSYTSLTMRKEVVVEEGRLRRVPGCRAFLRVSSGPKGSSGV